MLRLTLHYGKVGAIDYAATARHHPPVEFTRQPLPARSCALSDLEQGMVNLQRLPGATAT